LTVTVWPATVNVPVRAVPVVLAAMLNVTEPMPDPLAPAVTVIHDVVVVAVHEQDVPAVTLSVRLVAVASTVKLTGVTVPVQPTIPRLTVTVWPPTVNVPVRELPVVFCAMENVTEPMPEPVAPLVIVIQPVVVVALHEHDVPVMTLSVWVDAVAPTVKLVGVRVYEHCACATDTSAAQISTASPQHRAMFMRPSSNTPGSTRPGFEEDLHGAGP